ARPPRGYARGPGPTTSVRALRRLSGPVERGRRPARLDDRRRRDHDRELRVDALAQTGRRLLVARAAPELLDELLDAQLGQARRAVRDVRAHAQLVVRRHLGVEVLVQVREGVLALRLARGGVRDRRHRLLRLAPCGHPALWRAHDSPPGLLAPTSPPLAA